MDKASCKFWEEKDGSVLVSRHVPDECAYDLFTLANDIARPVRLLGVATEINSICSISSFNSTSFLSIFATYSSYVTKLHNICFSDHIIQLFI